MNPLVSLVAWSLGIAVVVLAAAMMVRNTPHAVGNLRRAHLVTGFALAASLGEEVHDAT